MDEATLQGMLDLTRRVFAGEVTRNQLARRRTVEIAFVAVAIMWVAGEGLLDDRGVVQGAYSDILEHLMSTGTIPPSAALGSPRSKSGLDLVSASRRQGLHRPDSPGRGGGRTLTLTPPPQLVALLHELGLAPAIQVFLREAKGGKARERAWQERKHEEHPGHGAMEEYLEGLVAEVEVHYDRYGLRMLKRIIDSRLDA